MGKEIGFEIHLHTMPKDFLKLVPIRDVNLFHTIVELEEADSTNEFALRMNLPEGSVVVAKRQTDGRGRKGRGWISPVGGLYFSLVLHVGTDNDVSPLPLVFGVAIHKALSRYCHGLSLKWPNDILHEGKKVCGILCELNEGLLIAGVGINVNNAIELEGAISMCSICGHVDEHKLLSEILQSIEHFYQEFAQNGFTRIREEWKKRSRMLGKEVVVEGGPIRGKVEDIDERGCLIVVAAEGIKKILVGDVSIRFI
jgi:BirA family biotin operon repressor/biotin-[acetyl-CoA-carboxylase] ligase